MSEHDTTDKFKEAQDLRARVAQATQKIVGNSDENWRPDGICVSVPLGFKATEASARESIDKLSDLDDTWQRNGALVRVIETDVYLGKDGKGKPRTGTQLAIQDLDPPLTSKALCKATRFWKYIGYDHNTHSWERIEPNSKIVNLVTSLKEYPRVPVLKGIVQSPSMRADGSILDIPGYDEATGWFFRPSGTFLKVPDQPNEAQIKASVACLAEPFKAHEGYDSFPFVSESHRWLPIAMAMTLLVRPAIEGCVPFFGFDATDAGTGKGMAVDVASIIATGREAAKSTFPAGNAEEMEKVLSSHAIAGSQLICFDNCSQIIRGDALEKIATTPIVEFRVLGVSEIRKLSWQSVLAFTGNQLSFHGDTARRVLNCRQESPVELPSKRANFKHADLVGWVKQKRPELVRAALTILRAYVLSGDTQSKAAVKGFGSFGAWSALVAAAIHWSTGHNVLDCRLELETADPIREAEVMLLRSICALQDVRQVKYLSTKEILDAAYLEETITYSPPTRAPVFPELREAFDHLITSNSRDMKGRPGTFTVARMLEKRKNAVRGGFKLNSLKDSSTNSIVWSAKQVK